MFSPVVVVTFAEFWKGVPFRWCTSENNTFSEAKRVPRKLSARVSSACISGSLQCRSGNQQEEIFSPVHCLRVRSRTTLSHEWHPRTLRAQTLDRLAHPFYSPPPTALCAQVEWKMTGRVVRSRTTKCYYIAFYTTPTKRSRAVVVVLDFSPSRVTSIPLHDRIQKRWAPLSFIKVRLIYISSVFICANWASLDVTIVVSILFAFFALRYGELSVAERSKLFLLLLSVKNCFTTYSLDRRWKNFRISLCDEISFWIYIYRDLNNNIRKYLLLERIVKVDVPLVKDRCEFFLPAGERRRVNQTIT